MLKKIAESGGSGRTIEVKHVYDPATGEFLGTWPVEYTDAEVLKLTAVRRAVRGGCGSPAHEGRQFQSGERKKMIERLISVDPATVQLEEGVALSAFGRLVSQEYKELGIEAPDWLQEKIDDLRERIRSRREEAIVQRLRDAKEKLAFLTIAEKKRTDLAGEIARLEKLLAKHR